MRIFVEPARLVAGALVIRGDEHHYLSNVRRAKAGDRIALLDGAGRRAEATIVQIDPTETRLDVATPITIPPATPVVRALVPLIKGDRMDSCLEKLVEVGVDEIVVWPAARSVVVLEVDRRDRRLTRYRAALQAAARQSNRAQTPDITIVDDLAAAIATARSTRFVLDPGSEGTFELAGVVDVTIASGPEGGLTGDELTALAQAGFGAIGMGPRILRAETAPVVAVAVIRTITRS